MLLSPDTGIKYELWLGRYDTQMQNLVVTTYAKLVHGKQVYDHA